jgi:hypothetical protein
MLQQGVRTMSRYRLGKTTALGFDGVVHVEFMDPDAVLGLAGRPEVAPVAQEIRTKLQRVLAGI